MLTDYLYKKLIINYNKNIKFSDYQATNFPEYSLITFKNPIKNYIYCIFSSIPLKRQYSISILKLSLKRIL